MNKAGARHGQEAFVLHHYDWSESSQILDLFTREQGRVPVAAKGSKRPYSQLRAVLLPFQRILVHLSKPAKGAEGEGVLTLRSAEWQGGATQPPGAALFSGYYLNELLMKLLGRQDPHPELFDLYAETLAELHSAEEPQAQAALRAFELRLLFILGLLPDLSLATLTQEPVKAGHRYAVSAQAGVIMAPGDDLAQLDGATLVQLQAALLHGSGAALRHACQTALQPLRAVLRSLLLYHLGGQPLRTRQLMIDVQKLIE
ncbi:MAG: DNA repair protein RecO [Paucibacter sp.]|nr:DNA repair protein RecO [Roseateles sp.]